MDNDFKKLDNDTMRQFSQLREKKVSSELLKNFSASVEDKIYAKQTKGSFKFIPRSFGVRFAVPVFAVLILASIIVFHNPLNSHISIANASEIDEDIAVLRDLGAWSEEDEAAADVPLLEDLVL